MLNLSEKLFLLTMRDTDSSTANLSYSAKFLHTLAGAMLLELILQKYVSLEPESKIKLQYTDNQLDTLLNKYIEQATQPNWNLYAVKGKKNTPAETIQDWLKIGINIPNLRYEIALLLAQKKIIETRPSKLLGLQVSTQYVLLDKEYKSLLINQLYEIIEETRTPELAEVMLLHLLKIADLEHILLPSEKSKDKKLQKEFKAKLQTKLQQVLQSNVIATEIKKLLADDEREKFLDAVDTLSNAIDAIADSIGDAGDGGDGGGDGGDGGD